MQYIENIYEFTIQAQSGAGADSYRLCPVSPCYYSCNFKIVQINNRRNKLIFDGKFKWVTCNNINLRVGGHAIEHPLTFEGHLKITLSFRKFAK